MNLKFGHSGSKNLPHVLAESLLIETQSNHDFVKGTGAFCDQRL
jgi:hypothetical protein